MTAIHILFLRFSVLIFSPKLAVVIMYAITCSLTTIMNFFEFSTPTPAAIVKYSQGVTGMTGRSKPADDPPCVLSDLFTLCVNNTGGQLHPAL